jgi:nicotinamidase-related amidase
MSSPSQRPESSSDLQLTLRHQEAKLTGRAGWITCEQLVSWKAAETAIIVVDVWDKHWSWGANERVGILAPRINEVLKVARAKGVLIVHAPSDVVGFYQSHPARQWVAQTTRLPVPALAEHADPPLPIDDSDEGSDTFETGWYTAWTRQHPAIEITPEDAISDNGDEIYSVFVQRGIRNVLYMGVHTNMCVLERSFAIKRFVRLGFNVALARDLTDAMYNPLRPPYVSHEEGTNLVIGFIEKFWAPTFASDDLTAARGLMHP